MAWSALALCLGLAASAHAADPSAKPDRLEQLIVKYKPGVCVECLFQAQGSLLNKAPVSPTLANAQGIVTGLRPLFPTSSGLPTAQAQIPDKLQQIYILDLVSGQSAVAAAAAFRLLPEVVYAQPNMKIVAYQDPNDPYFASRGSWGQSYDDLWGLKKLQMSRAWDITEGQGVVVAVIDTGIDYDHPDMAANVWTNPREIPNNGVDDDGNGFIDDVRGWNFAAGTNDPRDGHGHGTHVAGTIAAVGHNGLGVIGVAPRAKVMAVKALGDDGTATIDVLAQAMIYAQRNGAKVINNSWGCETPCPSNPLAEDTVRTVEEAGAIVVFAAGNSNKSLTQFSPQNLLDPKPIVVTAVDHDDRPSSFSNFGAPFADVAAPGGESGQGCADELVPSLLSLRASGTDMYASSPCPWAGHMVVGQQYFRARGTSMAAPHVSGVAALILATHPTFNPEQVRLALRQTVDQITQATPGLYGTGRINALKAVQYQAAPSTPLASSCPVAAPRDRCRSGLVDLQTSGVQCGTCGNPCAQGSVCASGICRAAGEPIQCPLTDRPPLGTWTELGPRLGGRLDAIVASPKDPSTILVGSPGGGVWITRNNGISWTQPTGEGFADGIVIHLEWDRSNPDRLFALTTSDLYATSDLGQTWTNLTKSGGHPRPAMPDFRTVELDPFTQLMPQGGGRVVLWAHPCSGLWYSSDGGTTIHQEFPFSGGSANLDNCIASIAADDLTGYVYFSTIETAAREPHLFRSTLPWNGGGPPASLAWQSARGNLPSGTPYPVRLVWAKAANRLAVATELSSKTTVYTTTDGGITWNPTSALPGESWSVRPMLALGPSQLVLGTIQTFQTVDFGQNWSVFALPGQHADVRALSAQTYTGGSAYLFAANDGSGSDATFHQINIVRWDYQPGSLLRNPIPIPTTGPQGIGAWQAYCALATGNPARLYVGAQDNNTVCSSDGGATWTSQGAPHGLCGDNFSMVFAPSNPDRAYSRTCDWEEIQRTDNATAQCANVTWKSLRPNGGSYPPAGFWTRASMAVDPTDPDHVVFAQSKDIGITHDGGMTILARSLPVEAGLGYGDLVSIFFDRDRRIYVGTARHGVYRSTDDGATWVPWVLNTASPTAVVNFTSAVLDGHEETYFLATTDGLYRQAPGGQPQLVLGGGGYAVGAIDVDPTCSSRLYAGLGYTGQATLNAHRGGVMVSLDGGMNWSSLSAGSDLQRTPITDVQVDRGNPQRIYAASFGRGVWSYDWGLALPACQTNNPTLRVSLISPNNGATFSAPAMITLKASATDSGGTVSKVEFFQGATKLGESMVSPFEWTWQNVSARNYSLTAKATDSLGAAAESTPVSITVVAPPPPPPSDNQPPQVDAGPDQIVSLAQGALLAGRATDDGKPATPGRLTLAWSNVSGPGAATFTDAAAAATRVSFNAAGNYVLRLTAQDGAASASDTLTVTVTGGGTPIVPPSNQWAALYVQAVGKPDQFLPGATVTIRSLVGPETVTGTTDAQGLVYFSTSPRAADGDVAMPQSLVGQLVAIEAAHTSAARPGVIVQTITPNIVNYVNVFLDAPPHPQPYGYLYVKVEDWSGQPISGATVVVVTPADGKIILACVTDARGDFVWLLPAAQTPIPNQPLPEALLDGRELEMRASHQSYAVGSKERVRVVAGQNTMALLRLGPPPSPPPPVPERVASVAMNPAPGTFSAQASVALSTATSSAQIRYTLDGTHPTDSSPIYAAPLTLSATTTIKARASKDATVPSGETTGVYTRAAATPVMTIVEPAANAHVPGPTLIVRYQASDRTGVDHVHLQLDQQPEVRDLDFDGTYVFDSVAAGAHTLKGYLAAADHSRIGEAVSVSFTVDPPTAGGLVVNVGPDRLITLVPSKSRAVRVSGAVTIDGQPASPPTVTTTWSKLSGPDALIADAARPDTSVTFSTTGTYVFKLQATRGTQQASDELTITVRAPGLDAAPYLAWINGQPRDNGLSHSYQTTPVDPALPAATQEQVVGLANTYDQALAVLANLTIEGGDAARALEILTHFSTLTTLPPKSNKEPELRTGEIVWIGLAGAQYTARTRDLRFLTGSPSPLARIAEHLRSLQESDGRIRGGPTVTFASTEHNLGAMAFFGAMAQLTSDATYRDTERKIATWLRTSAYLPAEGRFQRGQADPIFATDTSSLGALAIRALAQSDPQLALDTKWIGPDGVDLSKLLREAETRARVANAAYQHFLGTPSATVTLFRFQGANPISPRSFEWTAQMASAYQALGEAAPAGELMTDFTEATITDGARRSLAYAAEIGPPFADDASWIATRYPAIASTAWLLLADRTINPFELPATPKMMILSPADGAHVPGPTLTVRYQASDRTGVDHVHLQLDQQPEVRDLDFDGTYVFDSVAAGPHTLKGYLAAADHSRIGEVVTINTVVDAAPPPPAAGPTLSIVNPTPNARVLGPLVAVRYQITGSRTGVDHVVLQLDQQAPVSDQDLDGAYSFPNVPAGAHVLTASLAGANNAPIGDLVTVNFTVEDEGQPPAPPGENRAPIVNAGPDRQLDAPQSIQLEGQVTDDGLPNPPGRLQILWAVVKGPGPVYFSNATQARAGAEFVENGIYTLRLSAFDGALRATDELKVTVGPPTPPPSDQVLLLGAMPTEIRTGRTSYLFWIAPRASACEASGGWTGTKPTFGFEAVKPSATTTYTLTCTGASGSITKDVTVTVRPHRAPRVRLAAWPSTISPGRSSLLVWSSRGVEDCVASGGWTGSKTTRGMQRIKPLVTTTYTLTCKADDETLSESITVTVKSPPSPRQRSRR